MAKKEFISGLNKIGMSEREAKVYMALLTQTGATAAYIAKSSGLRLNYVYETIDSLVRQGYCTEKKVGRKRTFDVVAPEFVLDIAIERLQSDLDVALQLKEDLQAIYQDAGTNSDPSEYVEIIHGNDNCHQKYMELLRSAKHEMLATIRPPFIGSSRKLFKEQEKAFHDFLERGGKNRSLYEINRNSVPGLFGAVKDSFETKTDDFRIIRELPIKMLIFDKKAMLLHEISSMVTESDFSATLIKQASTIEAYTVLFNFYWEQGETYDVWIKGKEDLMERKLAEFKKSLL